MYFLAYLLHKQWKPSTNVMGNVVKSRVFTIKKDSQTFTDYFDQVQEQLEIIASMDDLLSGVCVCVCSPAYWHV